MKVREIIKILENGLDNNPHVADYDISKISYKKRDESIIIEFNIPKDINNVLDDFNKEVDNLKIKKD